jgi:hypothetical protein
LRFISAASAATATPTPPATTRLLFRRRGTAFHGWLLTPNFVVFGQN